MARLLVQLKLRLLLNALRSSTAAENSFIISTFFALVVAVGGFTALALFRGLGASVDLINEIGIGSIQARVLELNRKLTSRLAENGWQVLSPLQNEHARSAETLVAVEKPGEVVRRLFRRGVVVTEKPQGIRVATHFFNNDDDLEKLIVGLNETRR